MNQLKYITVVLLIGLHDKKDLTRHKNEWSVRLDRLNNSQLLTLKCTFSNAISTYLIKSGG